MKELSSTWTRGSFGTQKDIDIVSKVIKEYEDGKFMGTKRASSFTEKES